MFSDVHMLALMYAGELCYWCWSVEGNQLTSHSPRTDKAVRANETTTVASTMTVVPSVSPASDEEGGTETLCGKATAPSRGAVEPPISSASMDNIVVTTGEPTNVKTPDPISNIYNVMNPSKEPHSCTGLEQAMQTVSIGDTEPTKSDDCPTCGSWNTGKGSVLSQLFCVMEHCVGSEAVENWRRKFNPLEKGQELLSEFVEVARGPLKAQGWNYARAVQLLVTMRKAGAAHAH